MSASKRSRVAGLLGCWGASRFGLYVGYGAGKGGPKEADRRFPRVVDQSILRRRRRPGAMSAAADSRATAPGAGTAVYTNSMR